MNRTYLIVGGDEYERGEVAGNVARAFGTAYRQVKLDADALAGHRCAAIAACRQAISGEDSAHSVVLVENADILFRDPSGQSVDPACTRCKAIDEKEPGGSISGTGRTFLLAVDTPPGPAAWGGWRPDVVVYLSRLGTKPMANAGPTRPHVRIGSGGSRPAG